MVIKSDHGSAFTAKLTTRLLNRSQVTPLFSPKKYSQYNGAIERANSTHRIYTHQQAVHDGHPGYWTTANLDAARHLANAISRPWGAKGPCPHEAWQTRETISDDERDQFIQELEQQRDLACATLGLASRNNLSAKRDRLERHAVSATLETLGDRCASGDQYVVLDTSNCLPCIFCDRAYRLLNSRFDFADPTASQNIAGRSANAKRTLVAYNYRRGNQS